MAQFIEFALRHPLLVGATFAAIVAVIIYEVWLRSRASVAVAAPEAVRLINQGATVVDVREAARFDGGHIVDAVNIPPDELAAKAETRLKKKRPVLLVCDTGSRSGQLVGTLRKAGFDNAWSLDGGLAAWQRDNLPVVATRGKA
jgi:rhodanese-related sulfurtransferase